MNRRWVIRAQNVPTVLLDRTETTRLGRSFDPVVVSVNAYLSVFFFFVFTTPRPSRESDCLSPHHGPSSPSFRRTQIVSSTSFRTRGLRGAYNYRPRPEPRQNSNTPPPRVIKRHRSCRDTESFVTRPSHPRNATVNGI